MDSGLGEEFPLVTSWRVEAWRYRRAIGEGERMGAVDATGEETPVRAMS